MSPSSHAIAKAVAATAVAMLFIAGVFFYFFRKYALARYPKRHKVAASFHRESGVLNHEDIKKVGGNVKGLIVEENGVDVLYMMNTEGRQLITRFTNNRFNPSFGEGEEEKRIDVVVQRSKISKPHVIPLPSESIGLIVHEDQVKPAPPLPPQSSPMIHEKKTQPPPPPPPPPSPPPAPPRKEIPKAPPPSPPPLPKANGFISSLKPPPVPKGKPNIKSTILGESSREKGAGQTRLKPLHWDKVVANVDHSTVWDHINDDGSFRFDDELMETLFGYSTTYRTQDRNKSLSTLARPSSNTPTQIFILEPRKSQNTAIVLRSLAVSCKGILDALLDGQGLSVETLERLTKIAPTQEEEAKIMQFSGDTDKLADAESILYYILKAVPTAFDRLKAMLFRSSYDCEVLQLKEHLQAIERGCKELRTSALFMKLLEAILKAGNRMNAGTSRGNAQGFNVSFLRKLSDVKSSDGKTSLLHFIVEQVVQSEGKRQATYEKHNLHRYNAAKSSGNIPYLDSHIQQEGDREYLMLGLPVLGELSDELSEAKKAASIEYHSLITMCSNLSAHVMEIREIITCCGNTERGGFIKELKGFLEQCEEELKVVEEEQRRIMELVRKTNDYYLAGAASKDNLSNPFQLFVIVKDFVDTVDQACIELKRKAEKKSVGAEALSTPPLSPSKRAPLRFPNFDLYFLSNMSETTSSFSQSEDGF